MHNYYDPLISADGGLAISLGDEELFGLLDEFAAPPPPVATQAPPRAPRPAQRAAVKGQPRITKKSSKSTLRSRPSAASLHDHHARQLPPQHASQPTPLNMAQSAGAAAGPHAYASVEAPPTTFSDFRLAPAAAAAALRTPVKQEDAQSPSTVLAQTASTIRRKPSQSIVAPSPTPAARMRSASKLVAPASDMSPAKGMFDQPRTATSPPKAKPVPKPRKKRPQTAPGMSGAMSSFQVTLSSAEAQPIHVPKPPEKNMPPSVLVGVGAAGTVGASMAARAARASAQQYYYHPSGQNYQHGTHHHLPTQPQPQPQPPLQQQTQPQHPPHQQQIPQRLHHQQPQQQRQFSQGTSQGAPSYYTPYLPNSHANDQRVQDSRKMAQPFTYQYRPLVAPTRRQQPQPQPQPQPHSRHHSQHQQVQIPTQAPTATPIPSSATAPLALPSRARDSRPRSPLVAPKAFSPFNEVLHSPALEYDQKSLSPVFSPPVSRSSSMRSPTEDLWMAHRSVETPPTPHASLKIPEADDFSSWTDVVLDQWDLFSSDQLRP